MQATPSPFRYRRSIGKGRAPPLSPSRLRRQLVLRSSMHRQPRCRDSALCFQFFGDLGVVGRLRVAGAPIRIKATPSHSTKFVAGFTMPNLSGSDFGAAVKPSRQRRLNDANRRIVGMVGRTQSRVGGVVGTGEITSAGSVAIPSGGIARSVPVNPRQTQRESQGDVATPDRL